MTITRRLEFDAGHRIPNHDSKCRHIHGHRYRLEVTVDGEVKADIGDPDDGMILDYGTLKAIMNNHIVEAFDHSFLVYRYDTRMMRALALWPEGEHRTVVLPFTPTAENLSAYAYHTLHDVISNRYGERAWLVNVRLYETPNCWADCNELPTLPVVGD